MSYLGMDPGAISADDLRGDAHVTTTVHAHCPGCQVSSGHLDTERMDADHEGCTFGCGRPVDRDHGMCQHCGDHSANVFVCEVCGSRYENWQHEWQRIDA